MNERHGTWSSEFQEAVRENDLEGMHRALRRLVRSLAKSALTDKENQLALLSMLPEDELKWLIDDGEFAEHRNTLRAALVTSRLKS